MTRCSLSDCHKKTVPIVGDCKRCHKSYCSNHRMLEDHMCSGLNECRKDARTDLSEKLMEQKTIAKKAMLL